MARYVVHVRSCKRDDEAFAFMADLRSFVQWDPGVISAVQLEGDVPRPGSAFDFEVNVTYDAELTLNGPLAFANPLVGLVFNRIGDCAAAGLVQALDVHKVEAPA